MRALVGKSRKVRWTVIDALAKLMLRTFVPVCCIYHRPRRFDESSDEDSSGTESDSDVDDHGSGGARPSGQYRRHRHRHHVDGERDREPRGEPEHKGRVDREDRNAYERTSPRKGKE